jgi:uncharacterized membrane protein YhhN
MPGGFFVTVKTNAPAAYVVGLFLFLIGGVVLAGLAFSGTIPGGPASGVFGLLVALAAVALIIEYFATR